VGCDTGCTHSAVRSVLRRPRLAPVSVAHPDGGAPPCEECGAAITGGALECPKCGYIQQGGAPPEPSEEAIEAAREASAHTAELGMDDVLMSRRVTLKILRAAYAIDFGRAASRPGPHE
jgi:hypothetical protein